MWKFNPLTKEWTWVSGYGTPYHAAVYGTCGQFDPANTPGCRGYASASWVDTSGNFWLFGGSDCSNSSLNDLWEYSVDSNQWRWMSGSKFFLCYWGSWCAGHPQPFQCSEHPGLKPCTQPGLIHRIIYGFSAD